MDFDGINDYVNCGNDPSLTEFDNFTMEAWVWLQDSNNDQKILGKFKDWDNYYILGVGSGAFYPQIEANGQEISFSGGTVPSQEWTHLAVTFSKGNGGNNGTCYAYVDGRLVYSKTDVTDNPISVSSATYPFRIGVAPWDINAFKVDGLIDEVRIWNASRTAQGIREHMCRKMVGDESNLVGYWRFDQEVGTTLYDITSNDNDGTLTNMADNDWVACDAFNTWIGCFSNSWGHGVNWSLGTVPNSTSTNAGIPSYTGGNEPAMAGDYTCNHLSITSGATYTISSPWTLTVNGNVFSMGSTTGGGEVDLTGASASHAVAGTFENVELNESAGAELDGDATINGTLAVTSGDLDLSGYTLTMGSSATLSESDGNAVKGISGTLTTTRTFNAGDLSAGQNIAGMGAEITTDAALGHTAITRRHSPQTIGTTESILRFFDISPTNNTGLNATLAFHYGDSEMNGSEESLLQLYRSTDSGATWSCRGGALDTLAETITLSAVDSLSRWAALAFEGGFTEMTSIPLTGVNHSSVAWGDYDNDGDLDILLTGYDSKIYRNDGADIFADIGAGLQIVINSGVAWGDYDNDGDLDILLTGNTGSARITRIYRNDGADTFAHAVSLTGVFNSSVAWGDYDMDGDLDILLTGDTGSDHISRIYRNNAVVANAAPNAPASLSASGSSHEATLSWDRSTDTETAQDALTYNMRIGTSSAGGEIMPPMAAVGTGWRKVPALGNTNHNNTWSINGLPEGSTIYWSIQAIDNSFSGSAFATEATFEVLGIHTAGITDITKANATCGGDVTNEGGSSVTAKGVVWDTTENPTVGSNLGMTNDGSGPGSFTSSLTDLTSGQTYFVRAYATNAEQTGYGENQVFAPNMVPPGNALDFDGSDDYATIPDDDQLDLTTSYTFEAWIRPLTFPWLGGIITKYHHAGGGYLLRLTSTAPHTGLDFDGMNTTTGILYADEWRHVAAVNDNGTRKLYVDGVETPLTGTPLMVQANTDPVCIGVDYLPNPRHFDGKIDEVRIWNTARSEGEIQADMNKILNGDEPGLVAYYRFDHLSGTALSDRTTNDNDGTLMNMDDTDRIISAASVGHHSHVGLGTSNLVENVDVPVDITWDADPGTGAIFAAIQVDDIPDVISGLPAYYDSTYWELWIADDDGSYQADAAFHYDSLSGIWDETGIALYTRTAPGQSWTLAGGTTIDYEGDTTDGVGSITANDLTGFSQFIIGGGNEMTLTGTVQLDTLVLEWSTVPPATGYWVYGAFNEPYFDPQAESPFGYRLTTTADTTWSSPVGIADPDTNWTYQVIAVDGSETELGRTNRFGEHDFELP